jgi:hypothetical protein
LKILNNHEGKDLGALSWIYFNLFNADWLNMVVYYYFHPPTFREKIDQRKKAGNKFPAFLMLGFFD